MQTAEMKSPLKEWIENRSIRNHRSMNGEIGAILSAIRDDENKGGDLVTNGQSLRHQGRQAHRR